MIGRLNHVAIAVPDLAAAAAVYRDALGARVSAPQPLPAHGVTVVFVELPAIGKTSVDVAIEFESIDHLPALVTTGGWA